MKKIMLLLWLLPCASFAQTAQHEINEQVWKPFVQHFSEGNTDAFMELHSKDVIRLGIEGKVSKTDWETYRAGQARGDQYNRENKRQRSIELRFEYRSATDSVAYEIGYYCTSYLKEDGSKQDYFGKFNVILKKEEGSWRILLDADHSGITEADFKRAKSMDDLD